MAANYRKPEIERLECRVNPAPAELAELFVITDKFGRYTSESDSFSCAAYSIRLTARPTAEVRVILAPDDNVWLRHDNDFVFTSQNWYEPQSIGVGAVDDRLREGPHQGWVYHSAVSEDPRYNSAPVASYELNIWDNDPTFFNPFNPHDVQGDGGPATPLDALLVINALNRPAFSGPDGRLPNVYGDDYPMVDVNNDNFVTALDALQIINVVNWNAQLSDYKPPLQLAVTESPNASTSSLADGDAEGEAAAAESDGFGNLIHFSGADSAKPSQSRFSVVAASQPTLTASDRPLANVLPVSQFIVAREFEFALRQQERVVEKHDSLEIAPLFEVETDIGGA